MTSTQRDRPAPDYDVVVVGARCAGAATAMLLARAGLSVLAVDRGRHGSDTLSTHALTRPGVLQLSRWGVLDAVRAAGTPVVNRVIYHYDRDVVDVAVSPRGDVDGLYAPRRHVLDRLLVDAAVEAGADVRHGTAVRTVCREGDRVAGVVLEDRDGATPVMARLVVGADGARSLVARAVGAEVQHTAPESTATLYGFYDGLLDDAFHNYFAPGRAAGLIPTNGAQANVWVGVPMRLLERASPDDRARLFANGLTRAAPGLAARLGDRLGHGRLATFTGLRGFSRRRTGPGWALVGDAAYFKDPISAHGMTDALIGAELLARAVVDMADGEPESRAMAAYELESRRLTAPMLPAVEHAASFAWDAASLQGAHRAMNAAMRAEWEFLTGLGDAVGRSRLEVAGAR
jgi:flavin-dependent dehydrogenase